MLTSSTPYIAVNFVPITYNVSFDTQGGSSFSQLSGKKYTDSYSFTYNGTKEGYTFDGWRVNGNTIANGASISSGADLGITGHSDTSVTLTAIWKAKTYTVTKETTNCNLMVNSSGTYGQSLSISWSPIKPEGKDLSGPTVQVLNGGTVLTTYSAGTSATYTMNGTYYSSITVRAVYTATATKHSITVSSAGGGSVSKSPDQNQYEYGSQVTLTATPNEGYAFERWSDGSEEASHAITVTSNATYTATFAQKHTIAAQVDPVDSGTVSGAGAYASGESVTLTATPNEGYSFKEWSDGIQTTNRQFTVESNVTYTAVFTGNVYTVTFIALEGDPMQNKVPFTYGEAYGTLPTASRAGYMLEGWYTEPDGMGTKLRETDIFSNATKVVFANWVEAPTYTIVFNGEGATSGEMPAQTVYCGKATPLESNCFERIGYTFVSWRTANGASVYPDGASVTDLAGEGQTNELHAVWTPIHYWVAYDSNGAALRPGAEPIAPQDFAYDQAQRLATNVYMKGKFDAFGGWSNAVANVVYTDLELTVSNLCSVAGETNTLFAVWNDTRNLYTRVLGSTNLEWNVESEDIWTEDLDAGCSGLPSSLVVEKMDGAYVLAYPLTAEISDNGVLSFYYKGSGRFQFSIYGNSYGSGYLYIMTNIVASSEWQRFEIPVEMDAERWKQADHWYVYLYNDLGTSQTLHIGKAEWGPIGAVPEPGPGDAVESSSISISGGSISIGFEGDPNFSYHLLSTLSLLPPVVWQPYGPTNSSAPWVLTVPVDAEPSRFFKIETIRRQP